MDKKPQQNENEDTQHDVGTEKELGFICHCC